MATAVRQGIAGLENVHIAHLSLPADGFTANASPRGMGDATQPGGLRGALAAANLGSNAQVRKQSVKAPVLSFPGQIQVTSDARTPLAVAPTEASDAAALPRRVAVAMRVLLARGCEQKAFKDFCAGTSGSDFRSAGLYLASEIIRLRAEKRSGSVDVNLSDAQNKVLRQWIANLIQGGLAGHEVVCAQLGHEIWHMSLAGMATLHNEREILQLLQRQEKPATLLVVGTEDAADNAVNTSRAFDRQTIGDEGFALARALRDGYVGKAVAESLADQWEEYIVRKLAGASRQQALHSLYSLAVSSLKHGFFYPAQRFLERAMQAPEADVELGCNHLFLQAVAAGNQDMATQAAKVVGSLHWREASAISGDETTGKTSLHVMASKADFPQSRARQGIKLLVDEGADMRSRALVNLFGENLAEMTWPMAASVHAAYAKREDLVPALQQLELRSATEHRAQALLEVAAVMHAAQAAREVLAEADVETCIGRAGQVAKQYFHLRHDRGWDPPVVSNGATDVVAAATDLKMIARTLAAVAKAVTTRGEVCDVAAYEQQARQEHERNLTAPLFLKKTAFELPPRTFAEARETLLGGCLRLEDGLQAILEAENELTAVRAARGAIVPAALRGATEQGLKGPLQFFATIKDPAGLALFASDAQFHDVYDLASAFAQSLALVEDAAAPSHAWGVQCRDLFLRELKTPEQTWALLFAASQMRSTREVLKVVERASKQKIKLDDVAGPEVAGLLALAAETSLPACQAVASLLKGPAAGARWLQHADAGGDNVLHVACRGAPKLLEMLTARPGFVSTMLLEGANASGFAPLDEAVMAGNGPVLAALWRRRVEWGLSDGLAAALSGAAARSNTAGLAALQQAFLQTPAVEQTIEEVAQKLHAGAFYEQEREVRRLLTVAAPPIELTDHVEGSPAEADTVPQRASVPSLSLRQLAPTLSRPEAAAGPSLAALREGVRVAVGRASTEDALVRFEKQLGGVPLQDGEHSALLREAWRVIDALEGKAFGRYLGRHFASHRPSMDDAQLQQRLTEFKKYGSSRFGSSDAPAILRVRRRALSAAMRERADRLPGRYAMTFTDRGLHGAGYVARGTSGVPKRFDDSSAVRVIVLLQGKGEPVSLVSMYPVPDRFSVGTSDGILHAVA